MLAEFALNHAFTIGWFGLMTVVWLGWGQEDPPPGFRWVFGAGSIIGIALAGLYGFAVFRRWGEGSILNGREAWFGVLTAIEVIAAVVGCVVLARRGQGRWMAWWVALIVALHFLPLAWLLDDVSIAVLGVLQTAALLALVPTLRRSDRPTIRHVGPLMGLSLLLFALISVALFVARHGWAPWPT